MGFVVKGSKVFANGKVKRLDILVENGKIVKLAENLESDEEIDASGLLTLPGVIDAHVHFRDLGEKHKEDWLTGSRAAVAGGVTTVIDQPNTDPPTEDAMSFEKKLETANRKSLIDFGLNGGISGEMEKLWRMGVMAFGEIFMYEIGDEELRTALEKVKNMDAIACVHAEDLSYDRGDERCEYKAIELLRGLRRGRTHVCHVSTSKGLESAKKAGMTVEATPHHLFLSSEDEKRLGELGKMNPPLRSEITRRYLWSYIDQVDIIASDHAPHTMEEKELGQRGVPGVETVAPLMLHAVAQGKLSLRSCVDLLSSNVARIFRMRKGEIAVGMDADLMLVDMGEERFIKPDNLHSKQNWTPFEGMMGVFPKLTLVRGKVMYDHGEIVGESGWGKLVTS